jgi:hypothetical protein
MTYVTAQGSSVVIDRVTASINPAIYLEDSDEDGILDVSEDASQNGRVDPGETDPTIFTVEKMGFANSTLATPLKLFVQKPGPEKRIYKPVFVFAVKYDFQID